MKTASPLGTGDASQHPPPPGLPIHAAVNPPLDYMAPTVWQRPAFTAAMCAAPEVKNKLPELDLQFNNDAILGDDVSGTFHLATSQSADVLAIQSRLFAA